MKTKRFLALSIIIICAVVAQLIIQSSSGLTPPAYAKLGVARLTVITQSPVIRIQVIGINQNDQVREWNKSYTSTEDKKVIDVGEETDWWWRFSWLLPGFPDPNTLGPTVWVWYANGARDNKLCSKPDITLFEDDATCRFPAPPDVAVTPPLGTTCESPIYNGILSCSVVSDNNIKVIKVNPRSARFETVLATGSNGECRDVNLPNYSSGPGCIRDGSYPRNYVESMTGNYPKALVAFNADLFGDDGSHGPEGLTVKNGVRLDGQDCMPDILIHSCHDYNEVGRPSLSISSDGGNVRMGAVNSSSLPDPSKPWTWDPDPNSYWTTVGGTAMLVQNSNNVVEIECAIKGRACPSKDTNRARTAIGKVRNGDLIIVSIDESHGVSLTALAKIMIDLGAVEAINLDGGGSTQLWYNHNYLVDPNRQVADALLVFPEPPTSHGSSQTIHILPGETHKLLVSVASDQSVATSTTGWPGSDIVMALTMPSGRVINRNTAASDVAHDVGSTFETYTVQDPESGVWEVNLYGADVAPGGEDVVFSFMTSAQAPLPQLAYADGNTLVLNMGSQERRNARNIQPDEINEEFTVKQLGADKFSVTAFGLTQVFSGVTTIKADGDDGDDIIKLEDGAVTFTAPATITGGSGKDTIQAGSGDDMLAGGSGDDQINGGGGNDTISGDAGSDTINGEDGADTIHGGDDADTLHGNAGNDSVYGDDGADKIYGDSGDDRLEGGDGNDLIEGSDGNDSMLGGSGDDEMRGGAGADDIHGDAGQDRMYGDAGDDRMDGGTGNDYMEGNADNDTMYGGSDDDRLYGNSGDDQMYGDDGNDQLWGNTGNDSMSGGNGDDYMEGNEDKDVMHGGNDNDRMHGNSGDDQMYGDDGRDLMWGNAGNDLMSGGNDDDYMEGNEGADEMYGDNGQDDLIGGTPLANTPDGADKMHGGSGSDVMAGDNAVITRTLNMDGSWQVSKANGAVIRIVTLLDVQKLNNVVSPAVSAGDSMWGDENDDILYGQGGEDEIHGGSGDDYIEGNHASDIIFGDFGDDDLLGGNGPTTSNNLTTAIPGLVDSSTRTRVVPLGNRSAVTIPLGDVIDGGPGSDVILGDNGILTRPIDATGHWRTLNYFLFADTDGSVAPRHPTNSTGSRIDRKVVFIDTTPGQSAGSDLITGGSGEDDLYGQFDDTNGSVQPAIGDELMGNEGEDAMIGDLGIVNSWVITSTTQTIRPPEPFIADDVFVKGTLFRQVTLLQPTAGGNDRMSGGPGSDWMHGGAGYDLMNGNSGNDRLFGDDGDDAMWGGLNHDHLFGGNGEDYLDVKPRPAMQIGNGSQGAGQKISFPTDPLEWFAIAGNENFQNIDYIYGGWDADELQANVGDTGPVPGDRLIDWVGVYNVYYLCPGLYGDYVVTRNHSPNIVKFLQDLAVGDGAVTPSLTGSSGFNELAIVFPKDVQQNSHPRHVLTPGHFTCSLP
jgi:Ca2+-binding RTX toxin-like protein